MHDDRMHSSTERVIAVFQSTGFVQCRTHLFETAVSWLTGEYLWRQRHNNHLVMMPEQIRDSAIHNGAARGHFFDLVVLEQNIYVVGDVARAVLVIPIVFSADVVRARSTFNPNVMRRYPCRDPLIL